MNAYSRANRRIYAALSDPLSAKGKRPGAD